MGDDLADRAVAATPPFTKVTAIIPRVLIDTADVPGGDGQLKLFQRGDEFSIMLGGNELMNSRLSGSEEALASLACDRVAHRANMRMLIGGLGMGFTLRAALRAVQADSMVVVAELVPAVVAWARGPMQAIFKGSLEDPRVAIIEADVGAVMARQADDYDAILLDVDNGPDGLTRESNDRLYGPTGLASARRALRPGGCLLIWSAGPNARFTQRLKDAGFAVEEHIVRATSRGRGARHVIWIAQKPAY